MIALQCPLAEFPEGKTFPDEGGIPEEPEDRHLSDLYIVPSCTVHPRSSYADVINVIDVISPDEAIMPHYLLVEGFPEKPTYQPCGEKLEQETNLAALEIMKNRRRPKTIINGLD